MKNKFTIVSNRKSISDWNKFVTHCDDIDVVIVEIILHSVSLLVVFFSSQFSTIINVKLFIKQFKYSQNVRRCTEKITIHPPETASLVPPQKISHRSLFFLYRFFSSCNFFPYKSFFLSRSSFSYISNEIFNTHRKRNSINFTLTSNENACYVWIASVKWLFSWINGNTTYNSNCNKNLLKQIFGVFFFSQKPEKRSGVKWNHFYCDFDGHCFRYNLKQNVLFE